LENLVRPFIFGRSGTASDRSGGGDESLGGFLDYRSLDLSSGGLDLGDDGERALGELGADRGEASGQALKLGELLVGHVLAGDASKLSLTGGQFVTAGAERVVREVGQARGLVLEARRHLDEATLGGAH
jgi:hypothetical protein